VTELEALKLARDMSAVIHTLLHYTADDASVSYAYRKRDDALTVARNAAEAHAADLRRADSAFLRSTDADDSYEIVVKDFRSWAIVSLRYRPTGESGSPWRWIIQQHEVVETLGRDEAADPAPPELVVSQP
jgi:hypothetical protein